MKVPPEVRLSRDEVAQIRSVINYWGSSIVNQIANGEILDDDKWGVFESAFSDGVDRCIAARMRADSIKTDEERRGEDEYDVDLLDLIGSIQPYHVSYWEPREAEEPPAE